MALGKCAVGTDFVLLRLEPEKRKVGIDARITVEGVAYEVEPDLAGEKVILWWGLFDHELYVEYQDHRYGPYAPIGKPIPLHSYRSFKKTNTQKRADRIEALAQQLTLPASAIGRVELTTVAENVIRKLDLFCTINFLLKKRLR